MGRFEQPNTHPSSERDTDPGGWRMVEQSRAAERVLSGHVAGHSPPSLSARFRPIPRLSAVQLRHRRRLRGHVDRPGERAEVAGKRGSGLAVAFPSRILSGCPCFRPTVFPYGGFVFPCPNRANFLLNTHIEELSSSSSPFASAHSSSSSSPLTSLHPHGRTLPPEKKKEKTKRRRRRRTFSNV